MNVKTKQFKTVSYLFLLNPIGPFYYRPVKSGYPNKASYKTEAISVHVGYTYSHPYPHHIVNINRFSQFDALNEAHSCKNQVRTQESSLC